MRWRTVAYTCYLAMTKHWKILVRIFSMEARQALQATAIEGLLFLNSFALVPNWMTSMSLSKKLQDSACQRENQTRFWTILVTARHKATAHLCY